MHTDGRGLESNTEVDPALGPLGQVLEEVLSPSIKLCCSKNGARGRAWGCLGERLPGVPALHRTVMKTQFQREIKHTGRRGVDTVLCPERTDSVSREMDILIVGSQAGGAHKSRTGSPGSPGSPAGREKQGEITRQHARVLGTEVGEGRNE